MLAGTVLRMNVSLYLVQCKQGSPRLYPCFCFFVNILFFSQPDWYVEPDQNCILPLVKNGKIGNTSFV